MKKIVLVVPVYNEELTLESSIIDLHTYMNNNIKEDWFIIIANNASTDNTSKIAKNITKKLSNVKYIYLKYKGRGNALKHVWTKFDADVYAYCDADLSTNIQDLKCLFSSILSGNDIVIGSRYLKNSKVERTIKRLLLSKGYNKIVKIFFKTKLTDFQCGFKAVNKKVVKELIPKVKNKGWFFDTELLLLAQRERYRIKEIPINWEESKKSKVKILRTIFNYIINIVKLKFRLRNQ